MKTIISSFVMLGLVSAAHFAKADGPVVKEVTMAVNDVFVPEVVESGKDAKIVLSGMFPNSCYRWSRAQVVTSQETFHEIKAMASVTVNTMCLMVLVPYSKEVNLGQLSAGEHTLRFVSGDDTYFERKLIVQ